MIDKLHERIYESDNPIGTKKYSHWKLPPPDFAYGQRVQPDKEGVSISKIFYFILIFFNKQLLEVGRHINHQEQHNHLKIL